jgi:hypothetical protein
MLNKKPILVTGAHRSGSTWAGIVISASPNVRYIHEPFNVKRPKLTPPLGYWYEYISENTEQKKQQKVLRYLKSFYHWSPFSYVSSERKQNGWYRFLVDCRSRLLRRTLLKDPIALMSAEWMHETIHCDVIVMVRHPAAFIASLKVKGWQFGFHNFLDQQALMEGYLKEYSEEIASFAKEPRDIVSQGILLWNCLYTTVAQLQSKYAEEWLFVTHEALSISPMEEFKKIFQFLKVDWDEKVEAKILETTTQEEATHRKRDSKQNVHTWKERLSEVEIEKIKRETGKVWPHFYSESDW